MNIIKYISQLIRESFKSNSKLVDTEEKLYSIINNTLDDKTVVIINPLDSDCMYIKLANKNITIQINTFNNFISISKDDLFFQTNCSNKLMKMLQKIINKKISMQSMDIVNQLHTTKCNTLCQIDNNFNNVFCFL